MRIATFPNRYLTAKPRPRQGLRTATFAPPARCVARPVQLPPSAACNNARQKTNATHTDAAAGELAPARVALSAARRLRLDRSARSVRCGQLRAFDPDLHGRPL